MRRRMRKKEEERDEKEEEEEGGGGTKSDAGYSKFNMQNLRFISFRSTAA